MMKRQAISDLNTTINNVNTTKKYVNDKYKEKKTTEDATTCQSLVSLDSLQNDCNCPQHRRFVSLTVSNSNFSTLPKIQINNYALQVCLPVPNVLNFHKSYTQQR